MAFFGWVWEQATDEDDRIRARNLLIFCLGAIAFLGSIYFELNYPNPDGLINSVVWLFQNLNYYFYRFSLSLISCLCFAYYAMACNSFLDGHKSKINNVFWLIIMAIMIFGSLYQFYIFFKLLIILVVVGVFAIAVGSGSSGRRKY